MAQITPSPELNADGVTTNSVQITGAALRVSARSTAGACTLALVRMNPISTKWFRVTDAEGQQVELNLQAGDEGNFDWNFTLPAENSNEYYSLLLDGGSFEGYAEIESCSGPPLSGGAVPTSRTLTPLNGILLDGATAAVDLSADRTIGLGSVTYTKEANYTHKVGASTTATTVGGSLAFAGGAGATTGTGGAISVTGGAGGNDGVGGASSLVGGAAGGGNRAGGAVAVTGGAGAGSAAGGALAMAGGVGGSTGAGGAASMAGGAAGGAAAAGGAVSITGGLGNTTGAGGALTMAGGAGGNDAVGGVSSLVGGAAGGGNRAGGAASIVGGAGAGSAAGGAVAHTGGAGGATGAGGAISVTGGAGGATSGTGGAVAIAGGAGTNGNANGGAITLRGGAKNGSGTDGAMLIGDSNTASIGIGASGVITTFSGPIAASAAGWVIADPGNAGAIPVTRSGVCNLTSGGAETRTLTTPGFSGQVLDICMDTDGGDIVLTVNAAYDQSAHTTITFNDAGDHVQLVAATIGGTRRWRLVVNNGCTLG